MISRPKNSKTLLVLIAILLLANIGGLIFFLLNKPCREKENASNDRKNAMRGYLSNDIGFSETQMVSYDTLTAQHRRDMQPLFDSLKKEKEKRLKYISQYSFADTAITTAVGKTAARQQLVELKMLMHLKDVRNICSDKQKVKFDTSIYKVFAKKGNNDPKKTN